MINIQSSADVDHLVSYSSTSCTQRTHVDNTVTLCPFLPQGLLGEYKPIYFALYCLT